MQILPSSYYKMNILNVCLCFPADQPTKKELCKVTYNEADLELLRSAIEDLYYFEFVVGKWQVL